jgi:hypothetical protein
MALPKEYLTRSYQNVYDLAIQLYGDLSKIGILMELFPNLDEAITLSSSVTVEEQTDPIAKYFKDKRLIVATDVLETVGFRETDLGLRITDLGFRIVSTG